MALSSENVEDITAPLWKIRDELERVADAYPDLRDHFAGLAMQGFIANPSISVNDKRFDCRNGEQIKTVALSCYAIADVMLQAREGK